MKLNFTYIIAFLSFLLFLNCAENEKKKTPDTTNTEIEKETQSESKDSIGDMETLEALEDATKRIPHHYICYTNDDKSGKQLAIAFNAASNALYVKYEGQKDSIPLENIKEDFQNGGAYPTITQFYDEMLNGKKNGTYELTHSGNWDYVKYTHAADGKIFKYTINHDMTIVDGNYRETPCFSDAE